MSNYPYRADPALVLQWVEDRLDGSAGTLAKTVTREFRGQEQWCRGTLAKLVTFELLCRGRLTLEACWVPGVRLTPTFRMMLAKITQAYRAWLACLKRQHGARA